MAPAHDIDNSGEMKECFSTYESSSHVSGDAHYYMGPFVNVPPVLPSDSHRTRARSPSRSLRVAIGGSNGNYILGREASHRPSIGRNPTATRGPIQRAATSAILEGQRAASVSFARPVLGSQIDSISDRLAQSVLDIADAVKGASGRRLARSLASLSISHNIIYSISCNRTSTSPHLGHPGFAYASKKSTSVPHAAFRFRSKLCKWTHESLFNPLLTSSVTGPQSRNRIYSLQPFSRRTIVIPGRNKSIQIHRHIYYTIQRPTHDHEACTSIVLSLLKPYC